MTANSQRAKYDFTLHRDAWGQLVLTNADGQQHVGVVAARAFPISNPEHWISICDAEGHEIVCIDDLGETPAEARATLEEELSRREFVPLILRILSATTEEPSQWKVQTDRGQSTFQINSEDDVRRLEPRQASIIDSHGVRYLIPDVKRLDAASRRILDHFL
jgi:hypothetical protein